MSYEKSHVLYPYGVLWTGPIEHGIESPGFWDSSSLDVIHVIKEEHPCSPAYPVPA